MSHRSLLGPTLALLLLASCRFYAVGLPCDVDAHCATDQRCVSEVCVARDDVGGEGEGEASEGEGEGEGEGEDPPRTCAQLLRAEPDSESGIYTLNGVQVFCEMETAGGGWTLVARSVENADLGAQPFGWREATGVVDDVTQPYSLGRAYADAANANGAVFRADEVLVATFGGGVADVGADAFVVRYEDDARVADAQVQRVGPTQIIKSGCGANAGNAEPFMFATAGCSDFDDVYAFRDNAPCEPFNGLRADGWDLNGNPPDDDSDCASTGNLDGQQGLLFVRERRTCKSIRALDAAAPTGPTVVDGASGEVTVWCDMETQGGGWTLLARSVEGTGDLPFGWSVDEGSLDDTSAPYSLNAVEARVPAREMLIAEATDTLAPGPRQFLVTYPEQLNSPSLVDTDAQSEEALSVGSACVGEELGGTFMMQRAGCIGSTSHFYLRDNDQGICQNFGLFPGGFNLADVCCDVTACQRNGELLDRQGMIFTR